MTAATRAGSPSRLRRVRTALFAEVAAALPARRVAAGVLPWSLFVLVSARAAGAAHRSAASRRFPRPYNPGYFVVKTAVALLALCVLAAGACWRWRLRRRTRSPRRESPVCGCSRAVARASLRNRAARGIRADQRCDAVRHRRRGQRRPGRRAADGRCPLADHRPARKRPAAGVAALRADGRACSTVCRLRASCSARIVRILPARASSPRVAALALGALLGPMNGSVGGSAAMLSRAVYPSLRAAGTPAAPATALVCVVEHAGRRRAAVAGADPARATR